MSIGLRSEKFQEAFERFEQVVPIKQFKSYRELLYGFERWADPRKWIPTDRQLSALAYEAQIRGLFVPVTPRVKWAKAYEKKVKKRVRAVKRKYRGVGKARINALGWYVNRGYSANKIQKRMKDRGLGIRRKTLLRIVREMRLRAKKAKVTKYIPKKYRKKKR